MNACNDLILCTSHVRMYPVKLSKRLCNDVDEATSRVWFFFYRVTPQGILFALSAFLSFASEERATRKGTILYYVAEISCKRRCVAFYKRREYERIFKNEKKRKKRNTEADNHWESSKRMLRENCENRRQKK